MNEIKDNEQEKMRRATEEMERKIVKFTNIDEKESFTHSFRGVSITVGAGKSQIMRLPEGDHLAIHLARKLLARKKKEGLNKSQGVQLWNDKEVGEMKKLILTPVVTEDSPENVSPEEAKKRDLANLQKEYGDKPKKPIEEKREEVTKNDVIKDLEKRGVKVDASKTKDELLAELMELEAQGVTEKE